MEEENINVSEQVEVKRKKGRPKKEQVVVTEPVEKKKRGRKKKEVVPDPIPKPKKKRGRKAQVKYFGSNIRKQIPLTTNITDTNNLILHLDIKKEDNESVESLQLTAINEESFEENCKVQNETVKEIIYEIIQEQDQLENEKLESESDLINLYEKQLLSRENQDIDMSMNLKKLHTSSVPQPSKSNEKPEDDKNLQLSNRQKGFFEVLMQFIDCEKWLETTDVCCWWCCHTFDTIPIGLPTAYDIQKEKFRVKGVFCSFACVNAYKDEIRYEEKGYLISFLYKKLTCVTHESKFDNIRSIKAPPRCALKMFGGLLSIDEFRAATEEKKIYRMIEYPMYISKTYVQEVDVDIVKQANVKVFNDTMKSYVHREDNHHTKVFEDARTRLASSSGTVPTVHQGNSIMNFVKFD